MIKRKRKEKALSLLDVARYLDLPWFIYVYYEYKPGTMPTSIYSDVCELLDIDFDDCI